MDPARERNDAATLWKRKRSDVEGMKRQPASTNTRSNKKESRHVARSPNMWGLNQPGSPWVSGHLLGPLFSLTDNVRRAQGEGLSALGYGPTECQHAVIATGSHWRLRDYQASGVKPPILIVAAPIKQPYIWDLSPSTSVIRFCHENGLHVYLLEWTAPSRGDQAGLAGYAGQAIDEAVAAVTKKSDGTKPALMGHSLGGTFAAIYGALEPDHIRGLVLLGAPLSFAAGTSRFRDAMASIPVSALVGYDPVPGSLITELCALACPETFVWSRLMDAVASSGDRRAAELHMRIERWALDEMPLSGRLVRELLEWLYRDDRFAKGALSLRGRSLGLSDVQLPVLAVINAADEIAPPSAIAPLVDVAPNPRVSMIEYSGETGVVLQHLGIFVGRHARAEIWPQILAWIHNQGRGCEGAGRS